MTNTQTQKGISRRSVVVGAGAAGAAATLGALFGVPAASAAVKLGASAETAKKSYWAFDHHCSLVHQAMSDKLTSIVADPDISAKDTAIALRTTFCPCCNTQINASYPVVPWSKIGKAYG